MHLREVSERGGYTHAYSQAQLGVQRLGQGHLDSAQEVNWHLSLYQSTLCTLVHEGLELATLWFPSQVLTD